MTFRRLGVIIVSMLFFALLYCYFMVSVFTKKCYTQHDLLIYQLLTPKLIKQVPRVSSDWFFVSHTDEGSHLQRGNDSNLLIVFYVQIMPDDFVMQLHRF
jgi:hypothetical protein